MVEEHACCSLQALRLTHGEGFDFGSRASDEWHSRTAVSAFALTSASPASFSAYFCTVTRAAVASWTVPCEKKYVTKAPTNGPTTPDNAAQILTVSSAVRYFRMAATVMEPTSR